MSIIHSWKLLSKKCEMCGDFVNETKHKKCCASSVSYKQRYRLGKKKLSKLKKITDDSKIDYNQVITLTLRLFKKQSAMFHIDFYFLIDKIEDRGIHVENILLSNGNAISFKFGNNIKVFDLFLFMDNNPLARQF